jgi:uncharacterized protein (UPF0276 family)
MSMDSRFDGFGLGLRKPHYEHFVGGQAPVDFVEVISENFMVEGGQPRHILRQVRAHYPVALHGVSMSIGSADGVDLDYLGRLRALADEIEPLFVSDHLCWTRVHGHNSHDLLPLPYTQEALKIVCRNVTQAQDMLGRSMLVENPSAYLDFPESEMSEWEFLSEICSATGCSLLLDVNNIFVTARNLGFDADAYVAAIPAPLVRQIHVAGHSQGEELLIDTHDQPVCDDVWSLYARTVEKMGPVATMIERDDSIPPIEDLLEELATARGLRMTRPSARAAA